MVWRVYPGRQRYYGDIINASGLTPYRHGPRSVDSSSIIDRHLLNLDAYRFNYSIIGSDPPGLNYFGWN